MSPAQVDALLRDLPTHAQLVKDRPYRQIWRFQDEQRAYYLKFYPRRFNRLKRLFRGSPAVYEFTRLQWLQRPRIPAPRAVAVVAGLLLQGQKGDAVIIEAIEPSVPLDQYLCQCQLEGRDIPDRRPLARQLVKLLSDLRQAGLGHRDLHLGNFLLSADKLYLVDAYAVTRRPLQTRRVLALGPAVRRYAAASDLLYGWRTLGDGTRLPPERRPAPLENRRLLTDNRYFGRFADGPWRGYFFKHFKYPHAWSPASRLAVTSDDWAQQWPRLRPLLEADPHARILNADILLAAHPVSVVIRRWRSVIGFGPCAVRLAWRSAWPLIHHGIPAPWPLLIMHRRPAGLVTDVLIVFERLPGPTLAAIDLNALSSPDRRNLFRRAGRSLRWIDRFKLWPLDASAAAWIVYDDGRNGPVPIVAALLSPSPGTPGEGRGGGLRMFHHLLRIPQRQRGHAATIQRLLATMKLHPQYTPADSLELCLGYAPRAHFPQET